MFVIKEPISIEQYMLLKGCSRLEASVMAKYAVAYSAREVAEMFKIERKSVHRYFSRMAKRLPVKSQYQLVKLFLSLYASTGREISFYKQLAPSFVELAKGKLMTKKERRRAERDKVIKSLSKERGMDEPTVLSIGARPVNKTLKDWAKEKGVSGPWTEPDMRGTWAGKILDRYVLAEWGHAGRRVDKVKRSWGWF